MKKEDVLLRVPKIHYFRTRYREMSIPMALSSEIFIDETRMQQTRILWDIQLQEKVPWILTR